MKRDGPFCRLEPNDTFFFLHLPKTAGTTLRFYLENFFDPALTCPAYGARELSHLPEADALKHYRFFRGHIPYWLLRRLHNRPLVTITFLRDPVERVLSHYAFVCDERNRGPRSRDVIAGLKEFNLEVFLEEPDLRWAASDQQTRLLAGDLPAHDLPALRGLFKSGNPLELMSDDPQENIRQSVTLLRQMPFIGLVERFEESLDLLNATFGWPHVPPLQPLNPSSNRSRRDAIPPRLLDRIIELNQQDIAVYDAACRLFEDRLAVMRRTPAWKNRRRAAPPQPAVSYTFERHISTVNWYAPETTPEGERFCWTRPGTEAHLDFLLMSNRDVLVTFTILHSLAADILSGLSLHINGHAVSLTRQDENGRAVFQAHVPASLLRSDQRFTRLTFVVPRTLSPAELDPASPDTRKLGVAVVGINITPVKNHRRWPF